MQNFSQHTKWTMNTGPCWGVVQVHQKFNESLLVQTKGFGWLCWYKRKRCLYQNFRKEQGIKTWLLNTIELVQTSDKWHNEELSFYLGWCCVAWLINEFFDLKRKGRLERRRPAARKVETTMSWTQKRVMPLNAVMTIMTMVMIVVMMLAIMYMMAMR